MCYPFGFLGGSVPLRGCAYMICVALAYHLPLHRPLASRLTSIQITMSADPIYTVLSNKPDDSSLNVAS